MRELDAGCGLFDLEFGTPESTGLGRCLQDSLPASPDPASAGATTDRLLPTSLAHDRSASRFGLGNGRTSGNRSARPTRLVFVLLLAGQSSVPRHGVGGAESRIVLYPTSHIPHPTSHIPHPTSHIPHPASHIQHRATGNPQPHPSAATNSLHYRIQCLTQHRPAVANPLDFLRPKFDGMAVDNAAAADHRGN